MRKIIFVNSYDDDVFPVVKLFQDFVIFQVGDTIPFLLWYCQWYDFDFMFLSIDIYFFKIIFTYNNSAFVQVSEKENSLIIAE